MVVKVCRSLWDLLWGTGSWGVSSAGAVYLVTPRKVLLSKSTIVCCLSLQCVCCELAFLALAVRLINREAFWSSLQESSSSLRMEKWDESRVLRCMISFECVKGLFVLKITFGWVWMFATSNCWTLDRCFSPYLQITLTVGGFFYATNLQCAGAVMTLHSVCICIELQT